MRISYNYFLAVVALIAFWNNTFAQLTFEWSDEIAVIKNGEPLNNSWAGGINAAQASALDVNQDGLDDVFVFDRSGNKIMIFINNGSDDPNSFEYTFEYNHLFPFLRNWVLLRDYNCDGKNDIFTYGIGGFKLFKNTSTPQDGLQFELIDSNVQSLYNFGVNPYYSNIFITSQDLPAIDDLDDDGDLDIIVFSVNGSLVEYHQNFSVESYGVCDSIRYELRNRCYGYFNENVLNNSITLHTDMAYHESICPPGYNVLNPTPIIGEPDGRPEQQLGGPRHAGSTIFTLDLNQQLPKEIILGDLTHQNLVALINSETSSGKDSIVAVDESFPANHGNTLATNIEIFPAGFYLDLNNDGKKDLVAAPNNEWASINTNSLWYYRNTGQNNLPNFVFEQFDLFQGGMIDVGEGCTPIFVDINQDGLTDLLIGNKGYFISPGVYRSQLAYFQNTGTANNPEFTPITDDYLGLGDLGLAQGLHATFGDLDGDSDLDMLVGDSSGRIYRFNNSAGEGNQLVLQIAVQPIVKDIDNNDVDPGQFSTPQLFDIDRDGLLDLLIGERNGNINYYRNAGTAQIPAYELVKDTIGDVVTTEGFSTTGYSIMQFFELNDEYYLVTGTESGKIRLYNNIDDNLDGAFTLIDDMIMDYQNGIRSSVALIDINNDGLVDLFTGNYGGGMHFFEGSSPTTSLTEIKSYDNFSLYPNPAITEFKIKVAGGNNIELIDITIQNNLGQVVKKISSQRRDSSINIENLTSGIYLVFINSNGHSPSVHKLIVSR